MNESPTLHLFDDAVLDTVLILRLAAAVREELPLQLSGLVPGASKGLDRIVWSGDIWKRIETHPFGGVWVEVADVDVDHA